MRNIFIGGYWKLTATLILLSILSIFDIIWTIKYAYRVHGGKVLKCGDPGQWVTLDTQHISTRGKSFGLKIQLLKHLPLRYMYFHT